MFINLLVDFFEARAPFQRWKTFMSYKTLDVEHDPLEKRFNRTQDLVFAAGVFHSKISSQKVLGNARKLLRCGGRLLFMEPTRITPTYSVIYGTFSGGWTDNSHELDCLLQSISNSWDQLLSSSSFSGIEFFGHDYADGHQRIR